MKQTQDLQMKYKNFNLCLLIHLNLSEIALLYNYVCSFFTFQSKTFPLPLPGGTLYVATVLYSVLAFTYLRMPQNVSILKDSFPSIVFSVNI